jgi:hypothetical protein
VIPVAKHALKRGHCVHGDTETMHAVVGVVAAQRDHPAHAEAHGVQVHWRKRGNCGTRELSRIASTSQSAERGELGGDGVSGG